MKRARIAILGVLLLSHTAFAELQVGGTVSVLNFFVLPSNTGLSTSTNFGLGSLFAGISLGDVVAVNAFLSHDNTGTISGSGNLYGASGDFTGKFKVFLFGGELWVDPPFFPLYFRTGIGVGSLTSDFSLTSGGVPQGDPFENIKMQFAAHFGTGIKFTISKIKFFGGIDFVYIKVDSSGTAVNVSGIPFFRTKLGLAVPLGD